MEVVWSTHATETDAGVVVKRFQPGHHDGARREWSGLSLLQRHAPGLAPRPLREDLSGDVGEIAMEKLNGQPLRGLELSNTHLQALASAVNTLMTAPPPKLSPTLISPVHNPSTSCPVSKSQSTLTSTYPDRSGQRCKRAWNGRPEHPW